MGRTKKRSEVDSTIREAIQSVKFLENLPQDQFYEALSSSSSLELMRDEAGWLRLMNSQDGMIELDSETRSKIVKVSRRYWHRDPMSKQAVRLWTAYSLGTGMSFKAEKDLDQDLLETYTRDRANRKMFNALGQQKSSNRVLVDGEVFFIFFTKDDSTDVMRRLEPLHVVELIPDPKDDETIVAYVRDQGVPNKRQYIRDWAAQDFDFSGIKDKMGKLVTPEDDVFIYHAAFDTLQHRGNPLLATVCDWAKELRRFMESRIALVQALSRFAHKVKIQGGNTALTGLKDQLASTLTSSGQDEDNPPPASGSTWLENLNATMSSMPRQTGSSGARDDADLIKLQFSAGTAIMLHYFGDPSTGNLATSTAMELPMLKVFMMYQQFWTDVYRDIFRIILDDDEAIIDIDWPPIIEKDLDILFKALANVNAMYPDLMKQQEVQVMVLSALGLNNVSEIIKKADETRKKREQEERDNPPSVFDPLNPDKDEDPRDRLNRNVETLLKDIRG